MRLISGRERIGRALRASWTRIADPARRPRLSIRRLSSPNMAVSRCAVSTAPCAVTRTPSRKNASQAFQSPSRRTSSSSA